ncbi:M15 family metallopeptidase [Peribacillus sp. TH24]|uniref:M15 family metallopeptidase n=1 Tax=Peribacillus sp. TH24 TaxID=2798483 RepID=UPI0028BD3B20|nr:M15 family metallopeptidase [Peribacillus sp. TH24]
MKVNWVKACLIIGFFGLLLGFMLKHLLPPDLDKIKLTDELHPIVAEKKEKLIQQANEKGIVVIITAGFRTLEEQNDLYEKGRLKSGSIVTNARGGESLHNFGLAIDFALLNKQGEAIWNMEYDGNDNGESDWMEVVSIAKDLGFEWGGDWSGFKDYPHLQMTFGLSLRELQQVKSLQNSKSE